MALFTLLPVLGAPTAPRMNCALAFAYILGTTMLVEIGRRRITALALAAVMAGAVAEVAGAIVRPTYFANGPRGPIAFITQDSAEFVAWFIRNAHSGDLLWGHADLSFLLGLENPAAVQWVERDAYTRPEQVRDLIQVLGTRNTRFVLYYEFAGQGSEDNLQPFRNFLGQHYHRIQRRSDDSSIDSDVPTGPDCMPVLIRNAP